MIAVRIPEEIRKYKEKIAFGMTARQLISAMIACVVCVPLYYFGRKWIPDDVLSWAIILIACPLLAIGFLTFNGMPMEKFVVAWLKFEILYPRHRKLRVDNAFRDWQNIAIKEEKTKEKNISKKQLEQLALERDFLIMEAEKNGSAVYSSDPKSGKNTDFDADALELMTVKTFGSGRNKKRKDKKEQSDKKKQERLQHQTKHEIRGKEILKRIEENPSYVPTKEEQKILMAYRKEVNDREIRRRKEGMKQLNAQNKQMKKRRTAKTTIPKTVQKSIPIIADYEEGVFEIDNNKYSKMYRIKDINYRTSKENDQVQIFIKLGEFHNYFSEDIHYSFVIDNRIVSKAEQERKIFKHYTGDSYDRHRKEYNNILRRAIVAGRNDIIVEKFVTVTIDANSPIDAILRFHKIDAEVQANLKKIGSDCEVLSTNERLEYFHDKFRRGREGEFQTLDFDWIKKQGIKSIEYIAPSIITFERKYLQIEDEYYRVLYLTNLPASLTDEFLFDLCENNFPVTTNISVQPVSQDKGLRIVRRQLTGIEANKIDAEKRAIRAGYSPDTIQHSIKDAHAQAETLYDDMLNKNQKMFFVTITMMVNGSTLEELDENCKAVMSKARKYTSQLQILSMQQEEGFKVTLPFGYVSKELCVERTLTTESLSVFMPFANQELLQSGGFYYGLNQISQNLVIVNRTKMKTPSGFVLGSSGSGKSFATKREIINVLLDDDQTGVLIIDPENEYGDFCRAFGGTVLKISSDSNNYINPMDMPREYGLDEDDDEDTPLDICKDKAIKKKSEYIMSIVEKMISFGGDYNMTTITPQQKTIVDRCVRKTYEEYLAHDFDENYLPTLLDLQDALDEEGLRSAEARAVAEGVEYYTKGSMDIFSHKTNVNTKNRLIVFNVRDLGDQLRQIALIIVFDYIWSEMIRNKNRGVRTYCYCDEIHVMFQSYYSANFLKQLYKRGRKYGLCVTGMTQNVEDLLRSEQARSMIGNSDFIMMLNQASEDLKILSNMLNISETQMSYVQGADAGSGLLFAEKVIVPFIDRFPSESYLYKLMSTKFGEEMTKSQIDEEIRTIMDGNEISAPVTDAEIEDQLSKIYSI